MKILFFTRNYYPNIGGVERHVEKVSLKLIKKGYIVTVLTTKFNSKLRNEEIYKGVNILRFTQPAVAIYGLLYTWVWLIRNIGLIRTSDIVHIHDVYIWYWPLKLLLPKKSIYMTFHGWEGKYPIPFKNIVQKRLASYLSSGSISIGKYISYYYGIKKDIISYGATNSLKYIGDTKTELLYVGRLDEDTGLNEFLNMFEYLKNEGIEFCGDGEMREECEKYGKVRGFVDPKPYYEKAKYCFASGYLTIMEAMANKCVVFVVYDNLLKKDYYEMTPFSKYIVIGKSSEDLLKKYKYYENNPKEAQKMIDKGYNWVKHQSWDKMTNNYLKLWEINEKSNKHSRKTK